MQLKVKQRIALTTYFFLSGFGFSSWTSRIPTIKDSLGLNEAELGSILLAMPIASVLGLPISAWLVTRFHSRWPLITGTVLYCSFLAFIGYSTTIFQLTIALSLYAFSMRIINISMLTQSISLQKIFADKINGSFHGLWCVGGIVGVTLSTWMVGMEIPILWHLSIAAMAALVMAFSAFGYVLKDDRSSTGNSLVLGKPDPHIMSLGFLLLLAAFFEGGMFDWSGIYFKEVVGEEIFTTGYLIFMSSMAISRFASDPIIQRIGTKRMFMGSSILIAVGFGFAVVFPTFWMTLIGFMLVGFGTASVVPMIFILAGTSTKYSPGMAISIIVTYAMVGMLGGPPIIGYIAHAFSLKVSFVLMGLMGLAIIPVSRYFHLLDQNSKK